MDNENQDGGEEIYQDEKNESPSSPEQRTGDDAADTATTDQDMVLDLSGDSDSLGGPPREALTPSPIPIYVAGGSPRRMNMSPSSGGRFITAPSPPYYSSSPRNFSISPPPPFGLSPPRPVSMEQLMAAAHTVGNMNLAHQIVVDKDFKLPTSPAKKNGIEGQVRGVVERAFWDHFKDRVTQDPADYSYAMQLLGEMKTILLDLLMPHHARLKAEIDEVLDLALIQQQVDNDTINISDYSLFVIDTMAKLCAPARDEEVSSLKGMTNIVDLFRSIFRVLDLMKIDMANFHIATIRPQLEQQAIEYERQKFNTFLETQPDGLYHTRLWLLESKGKVENQLVNSQTTTYLNIVNHAYISILHWNHDSLLPETLLMDQERLTELALKFYKLALIASVLLVTFNTLGELISGLSQLVEEIKNKGLVLLDSVVTSTDEQIDLKTLSEFIVQLVNQSLINRNFPPLTDSQTAVVKGQIEGLTTKDNPVLKVISSRIDDFLKYCLTLTTICSQLKVPSGLVTIQKELLATVKLFISLAKYNNNVFGPFYAMILSDVTTPTAHRAVDS